MKGKIATLLSVGVMLAMGTVHAQVDNIPSGGINKAEVYAKLKEAGMSDEQILEYYRNRQSPGSGDSSKSANDYFRIESPDTMLQKATSALGDMDSLDIREQKDSLPYGFNLFRNGNLGYYNKNREINAPDDYVLNAGDEIGISVWGFSDFSAVLRIEKDGYVNHKLLGRVYLKDLTYAQARKVLASQLNRRLDLKNSEMAISLATARTISVHIVGEVENPGTYSISALNSSILALNAAGGPTVSGSLRNIMVRRNGINVDSLDIYQFLMDPGKQKAIYLQENDFLFVPVVGRSITVQGEVHRPQTYEIKGNENILDAIRFAGDFKAKAYRTYISLSRVQNNEQVLISIPLDSIKANPEAFQLHDGDQLIVNPIKDGYVNNVKAIGGFKVPGDYEVKEGDRVSDLLRKTGGLHADAYSDRSYLIRLDSDYVRKYISLNLDAILKNPGGADDIPLRGRDEVIVLSNLDFEDDLQVEVFGAVRNPGKYIFGAGLSLKDVILMSGGLKNEAVNQRIEIFRVVDYKTENNRVVPVKAVVNTVAVAGNLSLGQHDEDYRLQPFDEIFVRTNPDFVPPQNVVLAGEVMYPGTYALLRKDESVAEVIKRAGGLRDYAFTKGVRMYRSTDSLGTVFLDLVTALKRPNSRYNLILHDGDSIHIPKTLDLIHISGAIGNTLDKSISAPFMGRRANYYIRKFAGGFNENSLKRATFVQYPNGIERKPVNFGLFKIYPRVVRGSRIVVKRKPQIIEEERKPTDWNKVIENFTIKATGVLTLWI
ncbi:MAG: SLBB domain-containing protein, partial [Flavobacteriales bacterium]|nr:SLBB domain-containing protein [Flavobacteriales bacterium]